MATKRSSVAEPLSPGLTRSREVTALRAEVEWLRSALTDATRSLEAAAKDHDCEWCEDCAYHALDALTRSYSH